MCVRTLCSDPAHLHFSLDCLPNEEEIKKSYYTAQHTIKWIKTIYFRGPTRPVINVTTRKDSDKNQIITNINYEQNSLSLFWKQLNTKSKWHQIKPKKEKDPVYHKEKSMVFFLNAIYNNSTRKEQKGKVEENVAIFWKKINAKLLNNIMYQLKSLRDTFIPPMKEAFHFQEYVIRLQKEGQIQAKNIQKLHENGVPANSTLGCSLRTLNLVDSFFKLETEPAILWYCEKVTEILKNGQESRIFNKNAYCQEQGPFQDN